jgi:hypothetical protein
MAKASFVRTDSLLAQFDKAETIVQQEIGDLTIELAEMGAEKMREYIQTRGTNRTWSRPWPSRKTPGRRAGSGPGRIDSGDMLKGVDRKFQRGQKQSRAVFGWGQNFEEYFRYQEEEFVHFRSLKKVVGMFALRDSRRFVVSQQEKIARKYANRIARRLTK